jgi:hypothetical protein
MAAHPVVVVVPFGRLGGTSEVLCFLLLCDALPLLRVSASVLFLLVVLFGDAQLGFVFVLSRLINRPDDRGFEQRTVRVVSVLFGLFALLADTWLLLAEPEREKELRRLVLSFAPFRLLRQRTTISTLLIPARYKERVAVPRVFGFACGWARVC